MEVAPFRPCGAIVRRVHSREGEGFRGRRRSRMGGYSTRCARSQCARNAFGRGPLVAHRPRTYPLSLYIYILRRRGVGGRRLGEARGMGH